VVVPEEECRQQLSAGAPRVLADGQDPGQDLHRGLAGDQPQALAQLDRPAGYAVQQCRGSRIKGRPAARIYRGPNAGGARQPLPQLPHLGPFGAGQDDPQRVQQHQFRVPPHRFGNVLPLGLCDKLRQFFDLPAHGARSRFADSAARRLRLGSPPIESVRHEQKKHAEAGCSNPLAVSRLVRSVDSDASCRPAASGSPYPSLRSGLAECRKLGAAEP